MDRLIWVHRDTLSCEPIVRKLKNGKLILVSQCGGIKEPSIENRVYLFFSDDNGQSWTKPKLIQEDNNRAMYLTEVAVDTNEEIRVFITEHSGGFLDYSCYYLFSNDNGESWIKKDIPCFNDEFVFIRGMIKLNSGRIVYPYQHYPMSLEEKNKAKNTENKIWNSKIKNVLCGCIYSDDGTIFYKSNDIFVSNYLNGKFVWQWPEPTLIELNNNEICMLLRVNDTGYLYRSDSTDGGKTWCQCYKTDIPNPNNKPKLIKIDNYGIALINTPNSKITFKNRNPLEIWFSFDKMKTWAYKKVVLNFPGWLSYPDGYYDSERQSICFAFDFNRHDIYFVECDIPKK